jgi:RHS repeat-associated protein
MNTVVEQDGGGSLRHKYIYVNGMLFAKIDASDNKKYYHHDGLGSIVGISNSTPEVTTAQLFDDFGNWLYYDSNWDYYSYTGQEYDWPLMDALNLRAREYYPEYGRFMQEDPIGNRGGSLNWFLYTKNNPVNWTDITGKVCGSEDIDALVPDQWDDLFDFRNACSEHDGCYGDCISKPGKFTCDMQFLSNMKASCRNSDNYLKCIDVARIYFLAVFLRGGPSFQNARAECCPEE